jgi:hypothetical protein
MRLHRWLAFGIFVFLSSLLCAQSNDWALVQQLAPGQKVKVVRADGKSFEGAVQSVTDDAIRIGSGLSVPKQEIQRVLLKSPGRHGRNALIGLGVGAGVGVGFGAATGCDVHNTNSWCFFSRREVMAVAAPLFGGLGAGIGALVPSGRRWREIYRNQ